MKKAILILLVVILLTGGGYLLLPGNKQEDLSWITTYEQCSEAGYPIMESYPERCATPDGRSFTRDIGNELEFSDEIQVNSPRPSQKVTSPMLIDGQARGQWYFEASFTSELMDANGKSLGVGIVTAHGEWMTTEFVPFESKIIFIKPSTPTGKLIFKNANPSGLPENQKQLSIPVEFE